MAEEETAETTETVEATEEVPTIIEATDAHLDESWVNSGEHSYLLEYSGAALQGARSPRGLSPAGRKFQVRHPHSQLEQKALIIQRHFRARPGVAHSHFEVAKQSIVHAKLLYQRVEGTRLTPKEMHDRVIVRSKEAYAAPVEDQVIALDTALAHAMRVREEAEVNAYLRSKASKAARAQWVLKPRQPISELNYKVRVIQRAFRALHRRRRHQQVLESTVAKLASSKQLFVHCNSPPSSPATRTPRSHRRAAAS